MMRTLVQLWEASFGSSVSFKFIFFPKIFILSSLLGTYKLLGRGRHHSTSKKRRSRSRSSSKNRAALPLPLSFSKRNGAPAPALLKKSTTQLAALLLYQLFSLDNQHVFVLGATVKVSTHGEVHRQSYMGDLHDSVTLVNICRAVVYGQTGPRTYTR